MGRGCSLGWMRHLSLSHHLSGLCASFKATGLVCPQLLALQAGSCLPTIPTSSFGVALADVSNTTQVLHGNSRPRYPSALHHVSTTLVAQGIVFVLVQVPGYVGSLLRLQQRP